MAHKFLRDTGDFQFPAGADIVTSTTSTTGFLNYVTASITTTATISFTTAGFTDAVSINCGSTGVWFAVGSITVNTGNGSGSIIARIWDGTTSSASAQMATPAAAFNSEMAIAGIIVNPAGNIRISAQGLTAAPVTYGFLPKDIAVGSATQNLNITAIRIG